MFVLLEHDTTHATGVPPEGRSLHWDLLLEAPGCERLPTWRLARSPLDAGDEIPVERLPDHRPVYLDYEGELSGDRGRVRRLERGAATVEQWGDDQVIVTLHGVRLHGRFALIRRASGQTVFQRLA